MSSAVKGHSLVLIVIATLGVVGTAPAAGAGGVQQGPRHTASAINSNAAVSTRVADACQKINSLVSQAVGSGLPPFSALPSWPSMDDFEVADEEITNKLEIDSDGPTLVANVTLYQHPLKVVSYSTNPAYPDQYERILELWTADLTSRIVIHTPTDPPEEGPAEDTLFRANGRTYFIRYARFQGIASVSEINADLSSTRVCTLRKSSRSKPERIVSATEASVCHAVLRDNVSYIERSDAATYKLTNPSNPRGVDTTVTPLREPVDLNNDGHTVLVGIAMTDGMTLSKDRHFEWPIIIDTSGTATSAHPLNEITYSHAGEGENSARLFRYHGITYYERRDPLEFVSDDSASHEIWKFTNETAVRVCAFATDVIESFKIDRTGQH